MWVVYFIGVIVVGDLLHDWLHNRHLEKMERIRQKREVEVD